VSQAAITPRDATTDRRVRLAIAALFVAAFAIGCSPIFVRLSEVGPTVTAFYRTALAAPVLIAWAVAEGAPPPSPRDMRLLALAGFCFAGDLACWHWSIHFTSVANATVLANLAPIFVSIGAALWLGERITRGLLMSLAGAIGGSIVLASRGLSLQGGLLGDLLGLATAMFYGSYFLALSFVRARVSAAMAMAVTVTACSAFLLPAALLSGESFLPATAHGWIILVGLAMVSQVAGQTLIGWALAHLPASYSAVSLLLQPAIAALLAWTLLGERLGLVQACGGLIILVSVARRPRR
jgi:drug/metabolite transporter (DMT)-like permease